MARVPHPCATCGQPAWGVNCRKCGWAKQVVRTCARCGIEFTPKYRPKTAKFCSVACAGKARPTNRVESDCEVCGATFVRKVSDIERGGGRYCSRPCADTWRRAEKLKRQARPKPPKPPRSQSRIYIKPCRVCGEIFTAKHPQTTICSPQCKVDDAGARLNDLYALACQYRSDTGQYIGGQWRKPLYDILRDRDGDKCGICRRKINFTLRSGTKGNPRGPSIDHIVPRSQGGLNDLANLRCAHWACNQRRGNRGGNEQLALMG